MSTPQDGLANVIADVSFTIAGNALTVINRFQIGPASAGAAAGTVVGGTLVGIQRVGAGIVDVAIDAGKGAGPVTPGSSLQCEFSVAYTGANAAGTVAMTHTIIEGGTTASTATIRVYRFQFFQTTVANPGITTAADPAQCTITIRRKKELLPS